MQRSLLLRNLSLGCLLILLTPLTACKSVSSPEDNIFSKESVMDTASNWQLFIDDYWIAKQDNIVSSLHSPEKHSNNPLMCQAEIWEENPYCFGTVIFDEEASIFKFWYQSYNYDLKTADRTPILYATSTDGLQWIRPSLGVIEFQGSTDNNIVLQNYGHHDLYSPSVIKDELDTDPTRRYKMIWWDFPLGEEGYQDDGMCVAFSSDGIHWDKYSGNPVLQAQKSEKSISDVMSVMQDKNTGKFVAYTKGWAEPWPSHRQIVRTESSDFIHWSDPKVVIRHAHDLKDPQSYGMTTSQHGNIYIGTLASYKNPGDETIDIQLTVSHNNRDWSRVAEQKVFLPLGEADSWDDGMLFCVPMLNYGDKTLIYYSAWDGAHNVKKTRKSGIGLATLRLNGFVSLDAAEIGNVTTHPLKNADDLLLVNVDAAEGSLRAALLDTGGTPIPGYTLHDCIPIHTNDIAAGVRWKKHNTLPAGNQKFQIHFQLKNASLYGFYAGKNAIRVEDTKTENL